MSKTTETEPPKDETNLDYSPEFYRQHISQREWRTKMSERTVVEFEARDEKKHSVKWEATRTGSDKPALTSIYLNKPFGVAAKKLRVTIEVVE